MKQEDTLSLNLTQLYSKFRNDFPILTEMAEKSKSRTEFCQNLKDYLRENAERKTAEKILHMLSHEGSTIFELSTQTKVKIKTFDIFWKFLCGRFNLIPQNTDLFVDLYYILSPSKCNAISHSDTMEHVQRWPKGTDEDVMQQMEENKERMIHLLIKKIRSYENGTNSAFRFKDDMSYSEKYSLVKEWWNNHKFHLSMAIKNPKDLNTFLSNSLTDETMQLLNAAKKKGMPFFVTPYYLSLLNVKEDGYDDLAVRSYILYSKELVDTYGNIHAWEREDAVEPGKPNAAGWILPDGNNIHRRYPEVAIMIPDTMGRACGGLCASCQRMYDFQKKHLNFELDKLLPKENWTHKLERLMNFFENDTQLRDILITGGDALMSQNKSLRRILDAIYNMASRKRRTNILREDGKKYAEIKRVRIGSRLLAYLPMRIDDELVTILKEFKEKASKIGIEQFIIQTHFQSPLEVTKEAERAIAKILSSGWIITNQLVYTVAASRRGHTVRLREILNSLGVVCYYTFTVKGFEENYNVFTPNSRSLQEQIEEKVYGKLSEKKAQQLNKLISDGEKVREKLNSFMSDNDLTFVATDRSVLNLPAIGKSMTFQLIGIDKDGKRILRFNHDNTRRHSPIIEKMGNINIVENKSIASYLRQLKDTGENIETYSSIWQYTKGATEPCFSLYKYPSYNYTVTTHVSNIVV